ncbi:MAG: helix-turn-helix domain-containing protein [Candidatus Hydrogenedentes bacterium]|nr:helix-turn-helix domain-containing protein [Candidatus Hydrogenedentota bacterium]
MYLSIRDAAKMAGVSPSTIRRLIASGALTARRFGHQWRIPKTALSLDPKEGRGLE